MKDGKCIQISTTSLKDLTLLGGFLTLFGEMMLFLKRINENCCNRTFFPPKVHIHK